MQRGKPLRVTSLECPHKQVMLDRLDTMRKLVEANSVTELVMIHGDNTNHYDGWWSPSPNSYGILGFAVAMISERCRGSRQ